MLLKKSLARGFISYCVSACITLAVSAVCVLCGAQTVCIPAFVNRAGGELAASLLQPLLIGLIGFAFGAGSVLFEIERWSLLMQGAVHLTLTAAVYVVVHLVCFFPFTPPTVISFVASAFASYAITWGAQYFLLREKIRRLNEQILRRNGGNTQ